LGSQLLSIHRFGCPLVDGLTRRVALLFRTGCVFTSLSVSSRPPLACHPDGVPLLLVHSSLCLWLRLSKLVNGFVQSAARAEQSSTAGNPNVRTIPSSAVDSPGAAAPSSALAVARFGYHLPDGYFAVLWLLFSGFGVPRWLDTTRLITVPGVGVPSVAVRLPT
jgi:hypothetical protein